jgi:hypothetical protein
MILVLFNEIKFYEFSSLEYKFTIDVNHYLINSEFSKFNANIIKKIIIVNDEVLIFTLTLIIKVNLMNRS